jgi:hypothetical protein
MQSGEGVDEDVGTSLVLLRGSLFMALTFPLSLLVSVTTVILDSHNLSSKVMCNVANVDSGMGNTLEAKKQPMPLH